MSERITALLERASVGLQLLRATSGNPNHDSEGKFASGPGGGHGKHWAKRQRKKRRKKTLARLKKEGHAEIKELKATHRGQHEDMIDSQKQDWKTLLKEHRGAKKEHVRGAIKEHGAMKREHASETKATIREHTKEHIAALREIDKAEAHDLKHESAESHADLKASYAEQRQEQHAVHKAGLRNEIANLKAGHKQALQEHKAQAIKEHKSLKEDQADERDSMKVDHQEDRKSLREDQQGERHELLGSLEGELRERFPKRKLARGGENGQRSRDSRLDGGVFRAAARADGDRARFPASKTHKASSAESILSHCLRQRGWTRRWREGRLTGRQHLQLLEDVRQYGRQWMRHEAEAFFGRYGDGFREEERAFLGPSRDDDNWRVENPSQGMVSGNIDANRSNRGSSEHTRGLADRILSPLKRWFDRSRQFVRELIFGGAIALKGSELTAQEAEQADQLAAIQARYLDRFEQEIVANPPREIAELNPIIPAIIPAKPPMSPAQIGARAELYATAAWQGAQKVQRASQRKTGNAKWERRILGHPKTEHCTDCPPLAALGWQPVGSLPDIGDSECGPLCLCHFEYSDQAAVPEIKKPKPTKPDTRPKGVGEPVNPPAKAEVIQPKPTTAEIDAEVKKWIAGKPSRLTVKVKYPRAPDPEPELPEGYEVLGD